MPHAKLVDSFIFLDSTHLPIGEFLSSMLDSPIILQSDNPVLYFDISTHSETPGDSLTVKFYSPTTL